MREIQHEEWSGDSREHPPVAGGPVSMEPFQTEMFTEAVMAGGGSLQPLDDTTRGLLWVSPSGADQLQKILQDYPGIEWVQLPWAGVDAFAEVLANLAARGVGDRPVVTSAKGAYSEPVAEHALALVLGTMRELPRKAREAHWQEERTGISLFGRHIVLLGAGGVARAFLKVVAPFRPRVTVVRRSAGEVQGADRTILPEELRALPYARRGAYVATRINGLGPAGLADTPIPGDPGLHATAKEFESQGMPAIPAVIRAALEALPALGGATRRLLAGDDDSQGDSGYAELAKQILTTPRGS
jgi:hypothetical protein